VELDASMAFSIFRVVYHYPEDGCLTLLRNAGTYITTRRALSPSNWNLHLQGCGNLKISHTMRSARSEAYIGL